MPTMKKVDSSDQGLILELLEEGGEATVLLNLLAVRVIDHDVGALPVLELFPRLIAANGGLNVGEGEGLALEEGAGDAHVDGRLQVALVVRHERTQVQHQQLTSLVLNQVRQTLSSDGHRRRQSN